MKKIIPILLLTILLIPTNVLALEETFIKCGSIEGLPPELPGLFRNVINLIKIITPIILVIMGMIQFFQAVLSSDDDRISKATKKFIKKAVAALLIFFVISLTQILIGIIDKEISNDKCLSCFIKDESSCTKYTETIEESEKQDNNIFEKK